MLGVEELYHRYRDDVFRYLCSLTHDPAQAEDLLSETFLCAIQKAGSFRGEGSEKTWLFGIARRLWLQALRKHRPTVEYSDLLGLYVEDTVGQALDTRQLADRVRQLLDALPRRERTIVQLRAQGLLGTLAVYTGTPLGDWLARRSAVEYADQTYPEYEFEVEWISNRHWLCYEVGLRARNSEDTRFAVELARGRVVSDNFDENGYGGAWDRICELLYADVTSRLAGDPLLGQAAVSLWHAYVLTDEGELTVPAEGHPALVRDMPYDKANLPPVALVLDQQTAAVNDDTPAEAQRLMQAAKAAMDAAGIDIAAYQVRLYTADNSDYYTSPLVAAADLASAASF